jgi:hypothetical protein
MAARTRRIAIDDNTRAKIQATQLIKRLESHALGEIELTQTQVRSIEILLKKILPDLSAVEMDMQADVRQETVVSDKPMSAEEWLSQASESSGHPSPDHKPH